MAFSRLRLKVAKVHASGDTKVPSLLGGGGAWDGGSGGGR